MKIRFLQDIQQGATRLYERGEIIECDARMGRMMIGTKHAVASDEGLKSWRESTPGDVVMATPQGRVAIPAGEVVVRVTNTLCSERSTVLFTPHQLCRYACDPCEGYFDLMIDEADDRPAVFDYAILSH